MPLFNENRKSITSQQDRFLTTHWSVVIRAGQDESHKASEALVTLCKMYWYPLYVFVRRQGYAAADAQDLTQGFFVKLLEKNYVQQADKERGKFRSFLVTSLRHFLSNERDRSEAKKRGGGKVSISLDLEDAERRYQHEPADPMTAERLYERRWALTLLDHVLTRLEEQYAAEGKQHLFESLLSRLRSFCPGDPANVVVSLIWRPRPIGVGEAVFIKRGLYEIGHRIPRSFRSLGHPLAVTVLSDVRDCRS